MAVSVITPVWNRKDLTAKFLFINWRFYQSRPDVEFVIIDNGSIDSTDLIIKAWKRQMNGRLLSFRYQDNKGFGPANNYGAELAAGDILVFLSNDVTPLDDYITPIVEALAVAPNTLVGAEYLDFDTGWNTFNGEVIPYLGGWCLACNRATWEKIGGFDERFVPCDYEDLDLCKTAVEKGIELKPLKLPLLHAFGQSAQNLTGGRLQATLQNQKAFTEKWGLNGTA